MLTPQFLLDIHRELAVDLFAGGGGASTGIEQAIGRPVDIAINHDAEAALDYAYGEGRADQAAAGVPPSPLPQQVPLDPRIAQAVAEAGHDLYARADGVAIPKGGA